VVSYGRRSPRTVPSAIQKNREVIRVYLGTTSAEDQEPRVRVRPAEGAEKSHDAHPGGRSSRSSGRTAPEDHLSDGLGRSRHGAGEILFDMKENRKMPRRRSSSSLRSCRDALFASDDVKETSFWAPTAIRKKGDGQVRRSKRIYGPFPPQGARRQLAGTLSGGSRCSRSARRSWPARS